VQQLQRHPDTGQLAMHLLPVRLRVHADMLTTPREQARIHVLLIEVGDVVPRDALAIRGIDHRGHRMPRHALQGDLPPRQAVRAKP